MASSSFNGTSKGYLPSYLQSIDIYDIELTPYRVSYCCLTGTCFTDYLGDVLGPHPRFCILFRWWVPHFGKPVPQADLVDECNTRCSSTWLKIDCEHPRSPDVHMVAVWQHIVGEKPLIATATLLALAASCFPAISISMFGFGSSAPNDKQTNFFTLKSNVLFSITSALSSFLRFIVNTRSSWWN